MHVMCVHSRKPPHGFHAGNVTGPGSSRSLSGVKTRTLLLLAVACGLVILVAGSIKIFLIADTSAPQHLQIPGSTKVVSMKVDVTRVERAAGETLVSVTLQGEDDPSGALSWVLVTGTKRLTPHAPPINAGTACGATKSSVPTSCVLAFDTTESAGLLTYDRGGEVARWDITG